MPTPVMTLSGATSDGADHTYKRSMVAPKADANSCADASARDEQGERSVGTRMVRSDGMAGLLRVARRVRASPRVNAAGLTVLHVPCQALGAKARGLSRVYSGKLSQLGARGGAEQDSNGARLSPRRVTRRGGVSRRAGGNFLLRWCRFCVCASVVFECAGVGSAPARTSHVAIAPSFSPRKPKFHAQFIRNRWAKQPCSEIVRCM